MKSLLVRTLTGPSWSFELLERLKNDPRFKNKLRGQVAWDDIPVTDHSCLKNLNPLQQNSKQGSVVYFSSGSTGIPKRIDFSLNDWEVAISHRAACLNALGVGRGNKAAVLLPHGPWFSGDNITDALLKVGAQVISGGMYLPHLNANIQLLKRLSIDTLITTPSIALAITSSQQRLKLDNLILVGENTDNGLRMKLENFFSALPRSIFAASETILGYEDVVTPKLFHWDPKEFFLEIVDDKGRIRQSGIGQLLVTKRYGTATPLLRYKLGDIVELLPGDNGSPMFRFIGRVGHGFGLTTGVKVTRAQLDHFLDKLHLPIARATFVVRHAVDGTDNVTIILFSSGIDANVSIDESLFANISIDVADVAACGYLKTKLEVVPYTGMVIGKRKIEIIETPWLL